MKMRILLSTTLLALPLLCVAEQAPRRSTNPQIRAYQEGIEAGCRDAGRENGDSKARIEALCSCVIRTLLENVPADVWRQAMDYSVTGREELEASVMAPYMAKISRCSGKPAIST